MHGADRERDLDAFLPEALDDPTKLFYAGLEGNTRRAIDIRQGERLDEKAFVALIRAAAALNGSRRR